MGKKQDISAQTVQLVERAALEMYLEVLKSAFEAEGLRAVALTSEAFAAEVIGMAKAFEKLNQTERVTAGTIAAYMCSQWSPELLESISRLKG